MMKFSYSMIIALALLAKVRAFDRIVGGTPVSVDNYPFIVSVGGGCGGSIIRKEYPAVILTAAHCSSLFNSYVRLNANNIDGTNSDSFDSSINHYIVHPDYDGSSNDIALLFLEQDISSYDVLEEVEIDSYGLGSECCDEGDDLQVIGYGTDCSGCDLTPTLEFVDLYYMSRSNCNDKYQVVGYQVDNTMNCAAALNSDSCQGDSGGPLIRKGTNKQIGVVSWGLGCADSNYPGVYADLGIFYDWINQQMNANSNNNLPDATFDRIVGGTSVNVDQYPFIVSVGGGCGGSIIRKDYPAVILTAAHCSSLFNSYVRLNSNDISGTNSGSFDSSITRYVIHPDYDSNTNSNDIALLFLAGDISSQSAVSEVELDSYGLGSECCTAGDDLQVIGYGTDCSGCGLTPTLEYVDIDYVSRSTCNDKYGSNQIDDTMACAAAPGADSCQGDSGGPLIRKGTNEQIGVVSWGFGCADPNYPGVYADLGIFYDWINDQIDANNNLPEKVSWTQIEGGLKHVSVGSDGTIWGVNSADEIWRYNGNNAWTKIYGGLSQISVGSASQIYGVNSAGNIFKLTVPSSQATSTDATWIQIQGGLKHISAGSDGTVWGVNSADEIWRYDGNNAWTKIYGGLSQISVGSSDHIAGVNSNGDIFKLAVSSSQATTIENIWTFVENPNDIIFKNVDISEEGDMWAIDVNDKIYRYICGDGSDSEYWQLIIGGLKQIEVNNNGIVIGVNSNDNIWQTNDPFPKCN